MTKPNIHRLIELQKLMFAFREIKRELPIPGRLDERESDVEHSYTLAMAAWFLAPHFPHLDRDKMIRLALVHDLVEVHAGDTFAYGAAHDLASKKQREQAAQAVLAKEWRDFPELHDTLEEYENRTSEEAKFVYALDKIMPALIGYLSKGHFWHKHKITLKRFQQEKEHKVALSPELYPYYQQLYQLLVDNPQLMPEK